MQSLSTFLLTEFKLPKRLVKQVVSFYEVQHLSKDEFLVAKGKHCQHLCIIEKGYLRFFSNTEKKTITHWIFGQNQLISDVASFFFQ
jgi:hypothetical protein